MNQSGDANAVAGSCGLILALLSTTCGQSRFFSASGPGVGTFNLAYAGVCAAEKSSNL